MIVPTIPHGLGQGAVDTNDWCIKGMSALIFQSIDVEAEWVKIHILMHSRM